MDHLRQPQKGAFRRVRILPPSWRNRGVSRVTLRPQRAHQQRSGLQQGTDGARPQPVPAAEHVLELVQPHHQSLRGIGRHLADLGGVRGMQEPPLRQDRAHRLERAPGLAHGGTADEKHQRSPAGRPFDQRPHAAGVPIGVAFHVRREVLGDVFELDRGVDSEPPRIGALHPRQPVESRRRRGERAFPCLLPVTAVLRGDSACPQEQLQGLEGGPSLPQQVTDRADRQVLGPRGPLQFRVGAAVT